MIDYVGKKGLIGYTGTSVVTSLKYPPLPPPLSLSINFTLTFSVTFQSRIVLLCVKFYYICFSEWIDPRYRFGNEKKILPVYINNKYSYLSFQNRFMCPSNLFLGAFCSYSVPNLFVFSSDLSTHWPSWTSR